MARRKYDFYPTPTAATKVLIAYHGFFGKCVVFEPCHGDGAITDVLRAAGATVITSDIDPARSVDLIRDARFFSFRDDLDPKLELLAATKAKAVVTNPPFNQAIGIVSNFVYQGVPCAFLLRLSFLEPTEDRGDWLRDNPPAGLIVIPRISFTGDGKTDSVTCAWMLWNVPRFGIITVSKNEFVSYR